MDGGRRSGGLAGWWWRTVSGRVVVLVLVVLVLTWTVSKGRGPADPEGAAAGGGATQAPLHQQCVGEEDDCSGGLVQATAGVHGGAPAGLLPGPVHAAPEEGGGGLQLRADADDGARQGCERHLVLHHVTSGGERL